MQKLIDVRKTWGVEFYEAIAEYLSNMMAASIDELHDEHILEASWHCQINP